MLLSSCAGSATEYSPNNFAGIEYAQVVSENATTIDGVYIPNPEKVKTVYFSSKRESHLDGDTLYLDIMESLNVRFSSEFKNIESVYVTNVDCVPALYGELLTVKMTFDYPSLKNIYITPTGKKKMLYARPVEIYGNFGGSVVSEFYAHVNNWHDNVVNFTLCNVETTWDSFVFIGRNATLINCDLTRSRHLQIGMGALIEDCYLGLCENFTSVHGTAYGIGGYYTDSMYEYLNHTTGNNYPYPGYMWYRTDEKMNYQWTIIRNQGPMIDGVRIPYPEKLEFVYLVTDTPTTLNPDGLSLNLNVTSSKNVCFDFQFSNLSFIGAGNLFRSLQEDPGKDVFVNISIGTPSIKNVGFDYYTTSDKSFTGKLYLDLDLNDAALDSVSTKYTRGVKCIYTNLRNFSTTYQSTPYFGRQTQIFNARIEEYRSLTFTDDMKINSGYFDIDENATQITLGDYHARGGFYTQTFKEYAEISYNRFFVDEGFEWESSGLQKYPWTIGGTRMIDGTIIDDPTAIEYVVLTSNESTRIVNKSLFVNVKHNLNLNFDESYSSLISLTCDDLFVSDYVLQKTDTIINISVSTQTLTSVFFRVFAGEAPLYNHTDLCINIDFNGPTLDQLYLEYHNTPFVHYELNNCVKNNKGDDNALYISTPYLELNNCTFVDYNTLLLYAYEEAKFNSGYYDLNNCEYFYAPKAGYGGFYTDAFKTYVDDYYPDFLAEGYIWLETGRNDFPWTIKSTTLHPTKDEIEAELYDMTTIEDDIIHAFGYQIAYSYGYEGQENHFQIQVSFDYQSILDYFYYIFESWGNTNLESVDLLQIRFYTSQNNYMMYDLLHNKLYSCSISSQTEILIDSNPKLVDSPLLKGFKIITLDLGDLTGADSRNVAKTFQTELYIRIADPVNLHVEFFHSRTHRPNSDEPVNHSFAYLLNRYLDPTNPIYPQLTEDQIASLKRCKADLGL